MPIIDPQDLLAERDMLRAETDHLKRLLIATTDENERLGIDMRAWTDARRVTKP